MSERLKKSKIEKETKPKLRWYQYSLRSLLLVITVLCVWLAYISNEARKQKAAVTWVNRMGGAVGYEYQFDNDFQYINNAEPPGPDWLREWIGIDYFCNVVSILFPYTHVTDLSPLADLTSLEELGLERTQVSDLSPLVGLTNLKKLELYDNKVKDLSPLAGLTNLKELDVHENLVKDLSPLSGLTNLKSLELRHTAVTDLSPLAGLANLKELNLYHTQVADLSPLKGLTNLKKLVLWVTLVSEEEVHDLQNALPNCEINWYPWGGSPPFM